MRDWSLGLGGWGLRFRPQGLEFRLGGAGFAGFLGCIVLIGVYRVYRVYGACRGQRVIRAYGV